MAADNEEGPDPQNVRLEFGEYFDFSTPDGLSGTRYWPKMRCNASGSECGIGESGGPGQTCDPASGCAPPVDTKFEASFNASGSQDWVDISLVDGFTLPFHFEMSVGECHAQFGSKMEFTLPPSWDELCDNTTGTRFYLDTATGRTHWEPPKVIDCSQLAFDRCPVAEDLGLAAAGASTVDLAVVDPLGSGEAVGCYSPCSKLLFNQWGNVHANGLPAEDETNAPYCCPTPPESPEECRKGPVGHTQFVRSVHEMCPGVYGYAYDDSMGLLRCTPDTRYEVAFYCPASSTAPAPPPRHVGRTPCQATGTATGTATTTAATPAPAVTSAPTEVPRRGGSGHQGEGGWLAMLARILQVVGLSEAKAGPDGTQRQGQQVLLLGFGALLTVATVPLVLCRRAPRRHGSAGGYELGSRELEVGLEGS